MIEGNRFKRLVFFLSFPCPSVSKSSSLFCDYSVVKIWQAAAMVAPSYQLPVIELEMILEKWENQKHEGTSTSNPDFADEFGISICAAAEKTCCS